MAGTDEDRFMDRHLAEFADVVVVVAISDPPRCLLLFANVARALQVQLIHVPLLPLLPRLSAQSPRQLQHHLQAREALIEQDQELLEALTRY